jgi:hypothetical protein
VKHTLNKFAFGAALLAAVGGIGCSNSGDSGPLDGVDALVILQRAARNDMGDIFSGYTSYVPGAKLLKLSPPTADGEVTTLCCDQAGAEFANIDISGYDLSFDATQIVFAGKLSSSTSYGLFILDLTNNNVTQLPTDASKDYITPIFLPNNQILFYTTDVAEQGANQFEDEYERGVSTQVGVMNTDGTGYELGARNLSHRNAPSLASDGRVIFTQWDHLGPMNAGHLMFMNADMTELREAFGKEGTAASNSTLKAVEVAPGRFVGIGTARNRTVDAGGLLDIRLGYPSTDEDGNVRADTAMSEAHASYHLLSPDVPLDNTPSADTVGRYYDAYPLDQKDYPQLLVSWANGPVETSALSAAGQNAEFGVYQYDSVTQERHPIMQTPGMWDVGARPLRTRTAPPPTASQSDGTLQGGVLLGAMNVYTSTLHSFTPGSIYGVRVMEGFSSEEGFPRMFGNTEFEGHSQLAVAPVASDGSWLATAPSNIPLHLQTVDVYGMSLFNEPVWISGRANESRVCGGCHENRAVSTIINPGITEAAAIGPTPAFSATPRAQRLSTNYTTAQIMGVPWDLAVQPIFDANCVSCHNGDANLAVNGVLANPTYTITNPATGQSDTITFDLRGQQVNYNNLGTDAMSQTFSASYFSMVGPDMETIEMGGLMISGNFNVYMLPENAAGSIAIQELNPVQQFPTANTSVHAFPGQTHAAKYGFPELTPDQYYTLILAADMGANYYSRENNPHLAQ